MKTLTQFLVHGLAFLVVLTPVFRPPPTHAAEALVDVHGTGPGGPWFGNDNTVGWMFDALVPIQVTQLGVFNFNGIIGNPVGQAHRVGIWDAGGSLLLTGTVGADPGDTLSGVWEYATVTPTILGPGRYVIGAQYTVGSPEWVTAQPNTTDPALAFVGPRFGSGNDLPFPDREDANLFVGPNFQFTPVPEPTVVSLLLASGAVMGFRWYRRHKHHAPLDRRVAAAFHRVGEAKAARLPRIILNANVAAIQSSILQLKDDFENPTGGAGAKLIAPIYQGGALKTQVEIRTLEQKEAVGNYARLALRALGDVENALAAGNNLADREQLLQRTVTDNQRALELAQASYRVGRIDLRAVQQQQLSVYSARLTLLRVQSEQLAQRANLHLALGGSFAASPVQTANNPNPRP